MAPTWALLGCVLLLPSLRGDPDGCGPGWVPTPGGCLGFFSRELSWSRAESFCRRWGPGSHLAAVRSAAELRLLAELLNASRGGDGSGEGADGRVWIGLHRPAGSRSWRWSDGTAPRFASWHRTAKARRGGRCAALRDEEAFTSWAARPCTERNAFVCKAAA
ncbi:ovocleidin-17-like [Gallus gallus]|nr:ovocleidin-17-like [Gallus gallus]XP_040558817.1 ovocleidin-17-like [Gallus gallus]AHA91755.1 ovocleidin-17 [Gallus gallus]